MMRVALPARLLEAVQRLADYDSSRHNETWNAFTLAGDIRLPLSERCLGGAYGGDTSRREDPDAMVSIRYAVLKERQLKR